jgi:hypothetical protein
MKCAVEMGSGVMMYIPSFIKTGLGIETLIGGIRGHMGWRSQKRTLVEVR